MPHNKHITV